MAKSVLQIGNYANIIIDIAVDAEPPLEQGGGATAHLGPLASPSCSTLVTYDGEALICSKASYDKTPISVANSTSCMS